MGKRKGHFSQKGVGETVWGKKTKNLTVTLSEEGWRLIKEKVKDLGTSFSEIAERWARNFKVDLDDSARLPAELDSSKSELEGFSTLNLAEILVNRLREEQGVEKKYFQLPSEGDLAITFIKKLVDRTATDGDAIEVADALDIDTASLSQLVHFIKKGRKTSNGV